MKIERIKNYPGIVLTPKLEVTTAVITHTPQFVEEMGPECRLVYISSTLVNKIPCHIIDDLLDYNDLETIIFFNLHVEIQEHFVKHLGDEYQYLELRR